MNKRTTNHDTTTTTTQNTPQPAPLNRIITDANKRPLGKWKEYQTRLITPEEFKALKGHKNASGEAIICGPVSGGLEVIDIDTKNDPARTLHTDFFSVIPPELFARLYIVTTINGGAHIYYRCEEIENSKKLASRQTTPRERAKNPAEKTLVLIETRGPGGYVVAPPSPGYKVIQGTPETIPTITPEERAELFALARGFDELTPVIPEPLKRYENKNQRDTGNPFKEYDEQATPETVRGLLESFGWVFKYHHAGKDFYRRPGNTDTVTSGDYHHEKKVFAVFTTSTPFEPQRGYTPAGVLNVLQFDGNWKETARFLRGEGFGKPITGDTLKGANRAAELLRRNRPEKMILKALVSEQYAETEEQAAALLKAAETDAKNEIGPFWRIDGKGNVSFSKTAFFAKLHEWGIYRMKGAPGVLIEISGKVIRPIESPRGDISARVLQYLKETDAPGEVEEKFRGALTQILGDAMLEGNLQALDPAPLRDEKGVKYLPFLNGLAVMDKAGNIRLESYQNAPGYVWESSIIQHHFDPDPDFIFSLRDCEFYRFLQCIAGEHENPATEPTPRTDYFLRGFGYLCHNYKDEPRAWCIILSEETESEEKGGGTGKGLFMKAAHHAAGPGGMVTIPGKDYAPENRFVFSRVTDGTTLVFIDDAGKRFNFEGLYNAITEGLRFEKKGKDERFLPFSLSPKFALSTNYAVNLDAQHAARRARILEFAPTFGKHLTPFEHFGHNLFTEWEQHEWNRFYNLVFYAVSEYLNHPEGLEAKAPSEAAETKRLKLNFGREFVNWMKEFAKDLPPDISETPKQNLYREFLEFTGFEEREYTKTRFYKALEQAAPVMGLYFSERKKGNIRVYEFRKTQ